MLVPADAGFDAATFLDQITGTGARFPVRGDANRRPTITQRLPDPPNPLARDSGSQTAATSRRNGRMLIPKTVR